MGLVASFDPDQPRAPSRRDEAVHEAAFAIYWHWSRAADEQTARARFAKLSPVQLANWTGDAEVAFRVFERFRRG
jgi:hypothetical protein